MFFWLNMLHQLMTTVCVNLRQQLLFISSRAIKCLFSLSLNNDLKLFLSFVVNILSVNEGVSPGFEITSVWLLN